jgi:alkaline phosphatase D
VEIVYGTANASAPQRITKSMPPRSDYNHTSLITLTGLSASTSYEYDILVNGVKAKSGSFTTAPTLHQPAKYSYSLASCMSYQLFSVQPAWTAMRSQNPAFNILHGDNVYADSTSPETLWRRYTQQRSVANHADVIANAPTYATWDDHDYGPNDSNGSEPGKADSLKTFKELWANPSYGTGTTPGVFHTFTWGNVQFIVLDDRYHRSPDSAAQTNAKSQFGVAQRDWLFSQLKNSRSVFKVIVTGTTLVSSGAYSNERKIIADYINDNDIYGVVYHVGDAHRVQLKVEDHGQGYPMVEIMSSGIAKVKDRPWAMIDVDTTIPDPSLSYRFFELEKQIDSQSFRLSTLTKAGVNDIILNFPLGGEKLVPGSRQTIRWTRVGTGNGNVKIEYNTGTGWRSIAASVPNTGSYNWMVPVEKSSTVKIRVSSLDGQISDQSPADFHIVSATTPPAPSNLILNPSFELGGTAPTSWSRGGSAIGSTADAVDGDYSLRIATAGSNSPTTQTIATIIGKTYDISVWINASAMTSGKAVFDTNDKYDALGQGQFVMNSANTGWTQYSGSFTASAASVTLRMFTQSPFAGTVYFDNIVLNEKPAVTFRSWIDSYFDSSLDFSKVGFVADPDVDGLANGIEFVLNGNPAITDAATIMPSAARDGDDFIFTFARSDASESRTSTIVQYGSELGRWTDMAITATNGGSGGPRYTVAEGTPVTDPDMITVTIPLGGASRFFARLKVIDLPIE